MDKLYMVRRAGEGAEIWSKDQDVLVALVTDGPHELGLAQQITELPAMVAALRKIDRLNDHPAWFRTELNNIVAPILARIDGKVATANFTGPFTHEPPAGFKAYDGGEG